MTRAGRVDALERLAREGDVDRLYEALRGLRLRQLGELLLEVPERCSALRELLPRMPSDRVQTDWNGNSGAALLEQGLSFVETLAAEYRRLSGRPLERARILDYGCGWGRLIRLMYAFSGPDRVHGCDAWEPSLQLCREHGVRARLARCDEVPTRLPFPGVEFDLVYAYSVLTHLSERTGRAVMGALRQGVAAHGVCAVTVRPAGYWDAHPQQQSPVDVERMKREHAARGFAFTPHARAPVGGEVTYGDASISPEYAAGNWSGWRVACERPLRADPLQRILFLTPA